MSSPEEGASDENMLRAESKLRALMALQQTRNASSSLAAAIKPRTGVLLTDASDRQSTLAVLATLGHFPSNSKLTVIDRSNCPDSSADMARRVKLIRDVYSTCPNGPTVSLVMDENQPGGDVVDRHHAAISGSDAVFVTPAVARESGDLLARLSALGAGPLMISSTSDRSVEELLESLPPFDSSAPAVYDNVVLGGTFDRLHNGHRLFLATAFQLTRKRLTIGMTSPEMLRRKTLGDIIEPFEYRKAAVERFLSSLQRDVEINIERITDVAGPAGTDAALQLLVLTPEVASGLDVINNIRTEKGLAPLNGHITDLAMVTKQEKLSSTDLRKLSLGRLQPRYELKPVVRSIRRTPWLTRWDRLVSKPSVEFLQQQAISTAQRRSYAIGLTGGIAAGKSSIAQRLEELGALVIYADQMAHKAYSPGTRLFDDIVEEFGPGVVHENGSIHRGVLGGIVFGCKERMNTLNQLCWPVLRSQVSDILQDSLVTQHRIVVVEAAVLVESGMSSLVDEVWTAMVPRDEAIKRIMERNKLSEEDAEKRVASQCSNSERLSTTDVVFSPLWEKESTFQNQIRPAWEAANRRAIGFHIASRGGTMCDVCAGIVAHYTDGSTSTEWVDAVGSLSPSDQTGILHRLHVLDQILPCLLNPWLAQAAVMSAVLVSGRFVSNGLFSPLEELETSVSSMLEIVSNHQHYGTTGGDFDYSSAPCQDSDHYNVLVALKTSGTAQPGSTRL